MSAFLYAATRTPFGRFNGALAGVRPDDLAAAAITSTLATVPGLDPAAIDDVVWGNANGAGEENRNVGRMAALLAGLPVSVPGTTVNRLCGSSLDAAMIASRTIESGDAEVVLTGGVESMTRAPWVLPKSAKPFPAGDLTAVSTTLGWRLVNPRMPKEWTISLGESNEQLRERFGISRERQDEFAARSHRLAHEDWECGFYDDLVTPVDGASAVLLGSERAAAAIGADPIARIAGRGVMALEPQAFGYAPVEAANRALARAGIGWDQVGAVELNEAFAVQSLACVDAWKIDPAIVNQKGGAIAIGHPLGASGGRVLATLAKVLRETGQRYGVAAICIGVGQGLAVVLENCAVTEAGR